MVMVPRALLEPADRLPAVRPGVEEDIPDFVDMPATDLAERMAENRGKYVLGLEMVAEAAKRAGDRKTYVGILKFLVLASLSLDKPSPRRVGGNMDIPAESSRDFSEVPTEQLRELAK